MALTAAPPLSQIIDQPQTSLNDLTPDQLLNAYTTTHHLITALQAHQGQIAARLLNTTSPHRSPSHAVAHQLNISSHTARKHLNRGADLAERLPHLHTIWADGATQTEHVDAILALWRRPELTTAAEADQQLFANWALLDWKVFRSNLAAWAELNDRRDPFDQFDQAYEDRRLDITPGIGGVTLIQIDIPNEMFAQFEAALTPIEETMFASDWAAAKQAHGDDTTYADLDRKPAQRRFDAFMELTRWAAAAPEGDPGAAFVVDLVMDYATYQRELARLQCHEPPSPRPPEIEAYRSETTSGVRLRPGFVISAALAGEITRTVFNTADHDITTSRRVRLFTRRQRKAMMARDRWCVTPACGTRVSLCKADHVRPHAHGGETLVSNGQMLCPACHRHKTKLQALGLLTQD